MGMDALIADRLAELRSQRGWSRSELSRRTVRDGFPGIPEATIKAIEQQPGRVPEARLLRALAAAFEIDPSATFLEYPIALARETAKQRVESAGRDGLAHGGQSLRAAARQHSDQRQDETRGDTDAAGGRG